MRIVIGKEMSEARGCSTAEAEALWKWLGTDAHILIPLKEKV